MKERENVRLVTREVVEQLNIPFYLLDYLCAPGESPRPQKDTSGMYVWTAADVARAA